MPSVAVRERPIILSGESVRAVQADCKTQTRRVVNPQPIPPLAEGAYLDAYDGGPGWCWWLPDNRQCNGDGWWNCPYGRVGDRLWVREAWSPDHAAFYPHFSIVYQANGIPSGWEIEKGRVFSHEANAWFPFRWRSPIHMSRWASRLTLEITGVRVERLQAISEADVQAEGCTGSPLGPSADKALFPAHWDQLNAKRGHLWASNCWVWVLEFQRI